MNERQKLFLPICIVVWTVTALVGGLLVWIYRLAYADEPHVFSVIWIGSDLALLHIAASAVFGALSLKLLEHLLVDLADKPTNAPK